jgi:hypothetical protein
MSSANVVLFGVKVMLDAESILDKGRLYKEGEVDPFVRTTVVGILVGSGESL